MPQPILAPPKFAIHQSKSHNIGVVEYASEKGAQLGTTVLAMTLWVFRSAITVLKRDRPCIVTTRERLLYSLSSVRC